MKKFIKKNEDKIFMVVLALLVVIVASTLIVVLTMKGKIYGSNSDWLSQHYEIANYIRNNFYETKHVIPNFSINLAAGQGFADFFYYGLLRPEILLSFLFPFIQMKDYLAISMIILLILSVELFYYWIRKEGITSYSAFIASILFVFSGPLLFHTHHHLMFMNYMPWLILAFIGIRRYLLKKKSDVLIIGVVLMIFASYFFSVSGIVMCGVYSIYACIRYTENVTWKSFSIRLLKCILHVCLGMFIASMLLLPVGISMIANHRPALENPTLVQLIKPTLDFHTLLVFDDGAFNVGLTTMALVALVYGFYQKKLEVRFLTLCITVITIFPVIRYVLNGMQYIRGKSLIPMLPLVAFLIAYMFDMVYKKNNKKFMCFLPIIILPYFFLEGKAAKQHFLLDACIVIIILLIYILKKWKISIFVYTILPFYFLTSINIHDDYVKNKSWELYNDTDKISMMKDTLKQDTGVYRFDDLDYPARTENQIPDMHMNKTTSYLSNYNPDYNNYYYQIMRMASLNPTNTNMLASKNPFFEGMMSVKYLYTTSSAPYGYKTVQQVGDKKVIENKKVLPMAYATSQVMSKKDFNAIPYPYNLDTIYNNAIVSTNQNNAYQSQIKEVKLDYDIKEHDKAVQFTKLKDGYRVKAQKNAKVTIRLKKSMTNEIVILRLPIRKVKNGSRVNTYITVNGTINMLSQSNYLYRNKRYDFDYFISRNTPWREITLTFSKGEYTIQQPKVYMMNADALSKRTQEVDPMHIVQNKDAVMEGTINVKNNGYFITSIPYQKGFRISVDGKETKYEEVNTAFVGFPIGKGNHEIKITYKMPGLFRGMILSFLGIIIAILLYVKKYFKKSKPKIE